MSIGTPEAQYRIIDEDNVIPYCFGEYEMPDETAAPAADTTASETTSPTTGNTSTAVIISFAAVAGAAALLSGKRK